MLLLLAGLFAGNIFLISGNECSPPSPINHGQFQHISSPNWPKKICRVEYSCDTGFKLNGSGIIYCFHSQWIGELPVCNEITCEQLKAPANGTTTVINTGAPSNGMDSIVEFRCNPEFTLVGDVSLVCLESGKWSSEVPQCVPEGCDNASTTTTVPTATTVAESTAVQTTATTSPQICDGNLNYNGRCYFLTEKTDDPDTACKAVDSNASVAEMRSREITMAVIDFFRSKVVPAVEDFYIGGTYDSDSNTITWGNDDVVDKDTLGPWRPGDGGYPLSYNSYTALSLSIYAQASHYDNGMFNYPPIYQYYRSICQI